MFNYQHYVPILKAQSGELAALGELSDIARTRMTPMLVFPPFKNVSEKGVGQEELEGYMSQMLHYSEKGWQFTHPIFIDLQCLDDENLTDNLHPVEYIYDRLESQNIQTIPVLTFSCSNEFKKEIAKVHAKYKRGVCIVIEDKDYGVVSIQNMLEEILQILNCKRQEIDIVIDYKTVNVSLQNAIFAGAIYRITALPNLKDWRTLTMTAVSFPSYSEELQRGMNKIPRVEWKIWLQMLKTPLKRMPTFGDYDTLHPDHPDHEPRDPHHNSRLRYTMDGEWLVLNEKATQRLSTDEFKDICCELVKSPDFCGREYSWGDDFIQRCANGDADIEKHELWRKACTNHHLTFIADKISSLDLT